MRVIVDRLSKTYRDQSGREVAALEDIALFQEFALFPWRTVQGNVEFGLEELRVAPAERKARAAGFIAMRLYEAYDSAQGYCGHIVRGGGRQGRPREVNPSLKERSMRLRKIVLAGALLTLVAAGPAAALEVGQKAPDFTLAGVGGKQVKLADMLGKGPIVVYTFIQAFTGT